MSSAGGKPLSSLLQDATRADLNASWKERENEAAFLIANGHRSMSLALRLYSLEIRLKSIICKHLTLDYLPKACKTHDLDDLIIFTGLSQALDDPAQLAIRQNWDLLAAFSKKRLNDLRYLPMATLDVAEANKLAAALDDHHSGVLAWLSGHP